jgi:hypothetical protein
VEYYSVLRNELQSHEKRYKELLNTCYYVENDNTKGYIPNDSIYRTFLERKTMGTVKILVEGMSKWNTEFLG